MTTSNIKLMLHAMRLGQPQDPQAALRALAEAIEAQDELIEELRAKIGVLQSHVQILGAKASHQAEPAAEPPPKQAYDPRARANYERAAAPQYEQKAYQEAAAYEPPPYEPPPGYDPGGYEDYREDAQDYEAQQPYEAPQKAYEAQRAYEPPPAERMPATPGRLSPRPGRGTLPHAQPPARSAPPPAPRAQAQLPVLTQEDSADEDYRAETVVVNKRDIEKLRQQEAPFALPPPGARTPEARKSIPGAPWARGARGTAPNAPPPQGAVNEDFTVDMPPGEADDGDTYRDRGYQPPPGRGRPPGGR